MFMPRDSFPPGVVEQLNWYVYRLIDPRNGETFYVGKGRGDRIFVHAKGAPQATEEEDAQDLKFQRIKEIQAAGLDVGHVVHRHGLTSSKVALEVEAALIDAYPGLTNKAAGHGSHDYGARHVEEIIREYEAEPFEVREHLLLISIGVFYKAEGMTVYDAVRGMWKIDGKRANREKRLVLARYKEMVVGAFRPAEWLPATRENFPELDTSMEPRWGFKGKEAESDARDYYVGKRVPDRFLPQKGGANPVRYCDKDKNLR